MPGGGPASDGATSAKRVGCAQLPTVASSSSDISQKPLLTAGPAGRRAAPSAPPATLSSGTGDEAPERARLILHLVEPVLDHVANTNDADEDAVRHHGNVTDTAFGHHRHEIADAVVRRAGEDTPRHQRVDRHI